MMREEGLEPTLLSEPDSKSGAAANYATPAGVESECYIAILQFLGFQGPGSFP